MGRFGVSASRRRSTDRAARYILVKMPKLRVILFLKPHYTSLIFCIVTFHYNRYTPRWAVILQCKISTRRRVMHALYEAIYVTQGYIKSRYFFQIQFL